MNITHSVACTCVCVFCSLCYLPKIISHTAADVLGPTPGPHKADPQV